MEDSLLALQLRAAYEEQSGGEEAIGRLLRGQERLVWGWREAALAQWLAGLLKQLQAERAAS